MRPDSRHDVVLWSVIYADIIVMKWTSMFTRKRGDKGYSMIGTIQTKVGAEFQCSDTHTNIPWWLSDDMISEVFLTRKRDG